MWNSRVNPTFFIILGICLINAISSSEAATTATKKKVCIIGAGATGLISAQQLAAHPDEFDIVAFERNNDIGGLWKYTDSIDFDENKLPVQSSMYAYLRTNLPKELMAIPNYRNFSDPEDRSSVTHETVLSYLRNFTDHFNLRQYIKFNHLVEKVTPIVGDGDWRTTKWQITVWDIPSNTSHQTTCNAVVVCNGHQTVPRIPKIPGIETFPGKVMHSHVYRKPEDFANETVVVLGAAASGVDIGIEIAKFAKTVYLSHNKDKITSRLPANLIQVPGVVSASGNTLTLKDGSSVVADSFLYCTGYVFDYPFLDEKSGITVEDNQVAPLYKHLVNVEHPSMSLVGLPLFVVHFPLFSMQAQYVVSLLQGKVELPSKEDMLKDGELNGKLKRYAHFLGSAQWAYNDELAQAGGFEPLPALYKKGFLLWHDYRAVNVLDYKESNLRISENGNIELVHPAKESGD